MSADSKSNSTDCLCGHICISNHSFCNILYSKFKELQVEMVEWKKYAMCFSLLSVPLT